MPDSRLTSTSGLIVACVLVWSTMAAVFSSAQEVEEAEAPPTVPRSQYYLKLGTEDELQFYVHVWGQVNKPGLYAVRDGTDLIALLAIAGGPTEDAKLTQVRLVRTSGQQSGSIKIDIQRYIDSGSQADIPILQPGDTVIVPAKLSHSLFRLTGFLSVLALAANVIVNATVR